MGLLTAVSSQMESRMIKCYTYYFVMSILFKKCPFSALTYVSSSVPVLIDAKCAGELQLA